MAGRVGLRTSSKQRHMGSFAVALVLAAVALNTVWAQFNRPPNPVAHFFTLVVGKTIRSTTVTLFAAVTGPQVGC